MTDSDYQVIKISAPRFDPDDELDGMVPKKWVDDPSLGKVLFKDAIGDKNYPEEKSDWSEKVVSELNQHISLPAARYEFATLIEGEQESYGSVSLDVSQPADRKRIPLEEFLEGNISSYRYPQDYTVKNVIKALENNNVQLPPNYQIPQGIEDGADMLAGILLVDSLVGNGDRHERNIELVEQTNGEIYLSPAFDHGYSLGASASKSLKDWIMPEFFSKDQNYSHFQKGSESLTCLEAFQEVAGLRPDATKVWLRQLSKINSQQIKEIFDRIPNNRITPGESKFAQELLEFNQVQLLKFNQNLSADNIQQERVNKIAPIFARYLELKDNFEANTENVFLKFNPESKVLTYQDKKNLAEKLEARLEAGKWVDVGSSISLKKESRIIDKVAPAIEQALERKKVREATVPSNQPKKSRRR